MATTPAADADTAASLEPAGLIAALRDARARTLELVDGLEGEALLGPRLATVNPLLWEIGHLAWFHEQFVLRGLDRRAPLMDGADALYDSAAVPHATRWDLPLPSLGDTLAYMQRVHDALEQRLDGRIPEHHEAYLYRLIAFHEDMHGEAFTYTRQTLGQRAPAFSLTVEDEAEAGPWPGDAVVGGGLLHLGAERSASRFVFDNEKWAHPVEIAPFRIAKAPVTNAEYAAFVEDDGYTQVRHWDDAGRAWLLESGATHPLYWRRAGSAWEIRAFDRFEPLKPHRPVIHVNWHEARAWCRWAGRRLPTEAEWEAAALVERGPDGGLGGVKTPYPWGDKLPSPARANLDGGRVGTVDVAAHSAGDSPWGCRQMIGNVWEWTESAFAPYPGFSPDAYREYSEPSFGVSKVLRGGAWATRGRMITGLYRNFFRPERRDIFAGFRTVAL